MKKLLLSVTAFLLIALSFNVEAKASDLPEFNEEFLTDGILLPPEENYMRVYDYDGTNHQVAKEYTTQSDDVMKLIGEWESLGEEAFVDKYGFVLYEVTVQHDCKLDDGDWHYTPSWDEKEYDYSVLPDYMCLYPTTPAFVNEKVISSGYNIDLYYMDEDGSNWGFFKDVVKVEDGQYRVLDLENHTLHFRSRYIIDFLKRDSEGNETFYKVFSDWCPETSVGKDGKQPELVNPEKLDAPILSALTTDGTGEDGYLNWNVFWEIPNSVFNAEKYFWIIEDAFEPICLETQYRVNEGEWIDVLVANAASLYGGNRGFTTEGAKESDKVEFRACFRCSIDEFKTSEWSNIVSNKAVDTKPSEKPVNEYTEGGAEPEAPSEPVEVSDKCKLCGVCPIQPLKICLFIWILVVLLLAIVITFFIRKAFKERGRRRLAKKTTLVMAIMILVFILVLVVFIILCVKNHGNDTKPADVTEEAAEIPEAAPVTIVVNGGASQEPAQAAEPVAEEAAEGTSETSGNDFGGYTEVGTWPTEQEWADMGLPYLELSENMDGNVAISGKDWIYPLNAANGIMFEAKPGDEQIGSFVEKLQAAGINGYYEDENYPIRYVADYEYLGVPMRVKLTQTEFIDMAGMGDNLNPKITVLVLTQPQD